MTGNSIWIGGHKIHFFKKSLSRNICSSNSTSVMMRFFCKIQHYNTLNKWFPTPKHTGTSCNIRIHSCSTHVFSDLIQYQNIHFIKRNARNQRFRLDQQFFFLFFNLFTCNCLYLVGAMKGILYNGNAKWNLFLFQNYSGDLCYIFRHHRESQRMAYVGTMLFSTADRQHLHQTTLYFPSEICMWFHSSNRDYIICLIRILIKMNLQPLWALSKNYRIHRSFHRYAHGFFCNTITCQNLFLSFCISPAVTSHCRKNKRFCPFFFQQFDHTAKNNVNITDFPASTSQCNRFSFLNSIQKMLTFQ